MRLEHLNLVVTDIEEALKFYRTAFPHWEVRGEGSNVWGGRQHRWCHFGDEYTYLTFNDNGEGTNRDLAGYQPGLAHFAFETRDIEGVKTRLLSAGFRISNPGAEHPFRKNTYFLDAEGFEVEFVEYLSDEPRERNQYDGFVLP